MVEEKTEMKKRKKIEGKGNGGQEEKQRRKNLKRMKEGKEKDEEKIKKE